MMEAEDPVATADAPHVELRVRDPAPACLSDRLDGVYERLRRLRRCGRVADVSVEAWGKRIPVETDALSEADGRTARSTYEAFEAWATRTDNDLEPAFSTRTLGSPITDDRPEVISVPVVCLAVTDGDDLVTVAPCSTATGVCTIEDCLSALQSGELPPTAGESSE